MNPKTDLRPGHYVDGKHRYALGFPAQAHARACELARRYERPVTVYTRLFHAGVLSLDAQLSMFWNPDGPRHVMDSIDSPQEPVT